MTSNTNALPSSSETIASWHVTSCKNLLYVVLIVRFENVILHIGTNDISGESSDNVATKIVRLSKNINKQSPTTKLAISGIIFRTDNENLNTNIKQVNELFKSACRNNGWKFISNHNIRKDSLNRSRLHLNRKGVALLASNFKLALNSF